MNTITKKGALLMNQETGGVDRPETVMVSAGRPLQVMLSELRFGRDYPGGSINVRKTNIGADEGLINSVRERGIDEALAVVEKDGLFYAADGDTRLDAAFKVVPLPEDRKRYPVNVVVHPKEHAIEISLAAGMLHRSLHPVDEFEAFAQLIQEGKTVDDLGRRYNMKVPEVRQALSLAAMGPKIRQAWRDGSIDAKAAEAFTAVKDIRQQEAAFERLKKRGKYALNNAYQVRDELKASDREQAALLKFVGREKFEAAGHTVNETLFSGDRQNGDIVISDPIALKAMAAERLDVELKKLTDGGWAWAISAQDAPKDTHAWRRLEARGNNFSAEQKKVSGCIVGVDRDGKIEVERGLVKPGGKVSLPKSAAGDTGAGRPKKKAKASAGGGKPGKVDTTLSNSLMQRLSQQLSAAVSVALANDSRVGLAAVIAGFLSTAHDKPIDVKENGLQRKKRGTGNGANFERSLQAQLDANQAASLKVLAAIAGDAVDLEVLHANHAPLKKPAIVALCDALDESATGGAILQEQIRAKFDLGDYLNSVNKEMCLLAIGEAVNPDEARKLQGKPKSDVVKFALANVKPTGWLPEQLRTAAYAGPPSRKAPADKPGKATPAAAKKAAPPAKAAIKRAAAKASPKKVKKSLRKKK